MPAGIGVLGSKGWPKGIDLAHGAGKTLQIQLAADGKKGLTTEKILFEGVGLVRSAVLVSMNHVQGRHAEHVAGPLAVAGGDDRRVYPKKAITVKEFMYLGTKGVTDSGHGPERVRARSEVGNPTQVFERMLFFANGIGLRIVYQAVDDHLIGLYLAILTLALRGDQLAGDRDRAAGTAVDDGTVIRQGLIGDGLNRAKAGAVVNVQKGESSLGRPARAQPALDGNVAVEGDFMLEDRFNRNNHGVLDAS